MTHPSIVAPTDPVPSDDELNEIARKLDFELCDFHSDLEALAWGCEQLWHSEFRRDRDNELLSHVPLGVLRLIAARTESFYAKANAIAKGLGL